MITGFNLLAAVALLVVAGVLTVIISTAGFIGACRMWRLLLILVCLSFLSSFTNIIIIVYIRVYKQNNNNIIIIIIIIIIVINFTVWYCKCSPTIIITIIIIIGPEMF